MHFLKSPGTQQVLLPALRGALVVLVFVAAYGVINKRVEAGQMTADNRIAAKLAKQDAYIKALEATLAKCLSPGDKPIQIGDELWFCGASNTGIKMQ